MAHPSLFLASRAASLLDPASDAVVAGVVGRAWCALDRPRRAAVRANRTALAARFPLDRPFIRYVASLLGWLRLLGLTRADVAARTAIDGLAPLVAASEDGRGTVLVAAHVGEWEWGAAALAAAGLPVVAVAGVQMRADWSPALRRAKERLGIEVVGPDASPVRLARALRRGAVVALLVDGDVVTATAPAAVAGRNVSLPLGPARLAARFGARLVAGRCRRDPADPARYLVTLTPLDATPGDAGDEARLHARVAAWLGTVLAAGPGDWCLFRPFFPAPRSDA
jgi:KDO2-lipid IV(A) lauroyltransferase